MTPAVVLGVLFGVGLFIVVAGLRAREPLSSGAPRADWRLRRERMWARGASGLGSGLGMYVLTGWPVGAGLAALAASVLPHTLARHVRLRSRVDRTEAIAAWAEMLRDTMAGAAGIEQAIVSTAPVAPSPIRPAVQDLARRLGHERLVPALETFAEDLADPAADLVVTALTLSAQRQSGELGALLGALARSARAEATLALRVDASRSRIRTAVRVVTFTTLGFALVLVLFNRPFLSPYDDALGQAWLLVVGLIFAVAFWQLERMAHVARPPRLLGGGRGTPAIE